MRLFVYFVYALILALLLVSFKCNAAEYKFTFNFKDGSYLKAKVEATTQWKALEEAGVYCGKFAGIGKKHLTEDQLADILETCANPSFK